MGMENVGKILRQSRGKRSQEEVAAAARVTVKTLQRLEAGQGNPTLGTLEDLARALKMNVGQLIGAYEAAPAPTPEQFKIDPAKQSRSDRALLEAAQLLEALARASAPRRALILALLYRDESYLDALPREIARAAQALAKVP